MIDVGLHGIHIILQSTWIIYRQLRWPIIVNTIMKMRSYFKNRKLGNCKSITAAKNQINPISHGVRDKPNCEQVACFQLIEESWNCGFLTPDQIEPDAFLRVTPAPHLRNDYRNKNNFKHLSLSQIKIQDNKNQIRKHRKLTKTQQSFDISNSQSQKYSPNPHLFINKEPLNLTQYIIAGPDCRLNTTSDCPYKLERSKYIRILKQMKNRNYKRTEKEQEEDKVRHNMYMLNSFISEKHKDIQRLFISSERIKVKKDKVKKAVSLRANNRSLTLDSRNYSNRFC